MSKSYPEFVTALVKPGQDIKLSLDADKCNLWHVTSGVCGEAGELLDAVKKHVVYGKPLDMTNMIEELGDMEFYLEAVRQAIGVSREFVLTINQAKLEKRYGATYSDKAAIERKDKQ